MMNLRSTLTTSAAAVALLAGGSAHAGDYYFSLFGGLSTFDDELSVRATGTAYFKTAGSVFNGPVAGFFTAYSINYATINLHLTTGSLLYGTSKFSWEDDFDSGWVVGAAFGRDFGSNWRGELELAYRKADVSGGAPYVNDFDGRVSFFGYGGGTYNVHTLPTFSTIFSTPIGLNTLCKCATFTAYGQTFPFNINLPYNTTLSGNLSSDGDVQVWSLMANLWYDFNFMNLNPEGFHTFVGGGVGVANLDLEYNASVDTLLGGTMGYNLDDSALGFAYQLGAGVGFDLGDGMMLSAQYRWFATSDVDVGGTDLRVESHNAIISLSVPLGDLSM